MPKMHWFYNGKVFRSLEFKQAGKPYKINDQIKQAWLNSLPKEKPKETLRQKIANWFNPQVVPTEKQVSKSFFENKKEEKENLEETETELDLAEKESEEFDLESIEEEYLE